MNVEYKCPECDEGVEAKTWAAPGTTHYCPEHRNVEMVESDGVAHDVYVDAPDYGRNDVPNDADNYEQSIDPHTDLHDAPTGGDHVPFGQADLSQADKHVTEKLTRVPTAVDKGGFDNDNLPDIDYSQIPDGPDYPAADPDDPMRNLSRPHDAHEEPRDMTRPTPEDELNVMGGRKTDTGEGGHASKQNLERSSESSQVSDAEGPSEGYSEEGGDEDPNEEATGSDDERSEGPAEGDRGAEDEGADEHWRQEYFEQFDQHAPSHWKTDTIRDKVLYARQQEESS